MSGIEIVGERANKATESLAQISKELDRLNAELKKVIKTVNVLGTQYTIEIHKISEDKILRDNKYCGYCCDDEPLIVLANFDEEEYFPDYTEKEKELLLHKTLRHEIVHAFFNESGLQSDSNKYDGAWARNEEMVDWFAIQSPKIYKVYLELGLI